MAPQIFLNFTITGLKCNPIWLCAYFSNGWFNQTTYQSWNWFKLCEFLYFHPWKIGKKINPAQIIQIGWNQTTKQFFFFVAFQPTRRSLSSGGNCQSQPPRGARSWRGGRWDPRGHFFTIFLVVPKMGGPILRHQSWTCFFWEFLRMIDWCEKSMMRLFGLVSYENEACKM